MAETIRSVVVNSADFTPRLLLNRITGLQVLPGKLSAHRNSIFPLCFEPACNALTGFCHKIKPTFDGKLGFDAREENFAGQLLKGIEFWQDVGKANLT